MKRTYRVNELARLARISVRTLHHYDAIGLLVPSLRTSSGYRLYDDDDVLRLQQILIGRELGLALEAIRQSLDDPAFDRRRALLEQRSELERRAQETTRMIRAIDRALEAIAAREDDKEEIMDLKDIFDGFDPSQYEEEAKQRWGNTDAYKESARRTKAYSKEDWMKLKEEQAAIYGDAFAALGAGTSPDDEAVLDIAERHRLSIDRWFYPCSREMHARLADMYEGDSRFAENIDKFGAGLTTFLAAAIRANAAKTSRGEQP